MSNSILNSGNNNINIDGATTIYSDFGGLDTYVLLPSFATATIPSNPLVTTPNTTVINDASGGTIAVAAGIEITSVTFRSSSVDFVVGGNTLRFIGDLATSTVTLGANALAGLPGRAVTLADLAVELGVTVPAFGDPAQTAVGGTVQADGTFGNDPVPGDAFILTNDVDVASANVFEANLVFTPGGNARINSLQDEDRLTGVGDNPTLNATVGNIDGLNAGAGGVVITPELNNIETYNVAFTGSGGGAVHTLDLQDATGAREINVTRVADGNPVVRIDNISQVAESLSITNSNSPLSTVAFHFTAGVLSGAADEVDLTLRNVNSAVSIQDTTNAIGNPNGAVTDGYETINMVSNGATNTVQTLAAEQLEVLNIAGTANTTIGTTGQIFSAVGGNSEGTTYQTGYINQVGTLTTIDASALEGSLTTHIAGELTATLEGTSGQPVNFSLVGTDQADTVRLLAGLNGNDVVALGEGTDTVAVFATAQSGLISETENLEVRNIAGVANTIGIDAAILPDLESVFVRNEGQVAGGGINNAIAAASPLTANIVNLTAAPASDITIAHSTTGNSGLGNNILQVDGAAGVTSMGFNLVDAPNSQPRFNLTLHTDSDLTIAPTGAIASGLNNNNGANAVTGLVLNDGDTESNSVLLTANGYNPNGMVRGNGTAYQNIELNGGAANQFFNLDSTANGFGIVQTGLNGNAASAIAAVNVAQLDSAVAAVYAGTTYAAAAAGAGFVFNGVAAGAAERLIATTIDAADYAGDVILRVGQATQNISTGSGNDTVIFDALADTRAGLTIADTVAMGTGFDTIIVDGNAGQLISLGASEWTNLSGVDALRFASNSGAGYSVVITDQFVDQADGANRLVIINNDGDLRNDISEAATVDIRSLSANRFIDFVGENGDTVTAGNNAATPTNRIIFSDATANGGHNVNGGDRDLRSGFLDTEWQTAVGANTTGNGNIYEVRNTAVVTEGDLANVRNFSTVVFNNDQAVVQTLTLELTASVLDAMADASHTASLTQQEAVTIVANDGTVPSVAGAALNIDGSAIGSNFQVNVTADNAFQVADIISLSTNVGGGGHTVNVADGAANDALTFVGGTGETIVGSGVNPTTVTVNGTQQSFTIQFQNASGLANATHNVTMDAGDTVQLIAGGVPGAVGVVSFANTVTFTGGANNDTIVGNALANTINGGMGNDTITGAGGADNMTGGAGADIFVQGLNDSVASTASMLSAMIANGDTLTFGNGVDIITDFVSGTDQLDLVAGAGVAFTSLINQGSGDLTGGLNYTAQGNFDAVTGVFTFAAAGPDAIVMQGIVGVDPVNTNPNTMILLGAVPVGADVI